MKRLLKNSLFSFMSLGVISLLTSCPNPNAGYPEATSWFFVNQPEVDKLLKSPEEIEFEGKKYKLYISFYNDTYRAGRGCASFIFKCNSTVLNSKRNFSFSLVNSNDIHDGINQNKIKLTDLWVIDTNKKFYFSTKDIKSGGLSYAPLDYTFSLNNDGTLVNSGVGVMRFETNEKEYFIKTNKILRGQQL